MNLKKLYLGFLKNGMSANIPKFKALFLNSNMISDEIQLSVNEYDVPIVSSAKLLGVTFDDKLNFNEHVEILCRKASLQINAIVRLAKFLDKRTLRILYNLYYNSVRTSVCLCVCSRTPPRPFDGFTSFLVKRCFSYPGYTLSIFRDLELNVKVTRVAKVPKSSKKKNQLWTTYSCDTSK